MMNNWQPSATIEALKQRAELLKNIRVFFQDKNVLEVETPILAYSTIPDPNILSLKTSIFGQTYYLQTSPEFHMKRLLSANSGDIFQISKAFRDDESGNFHNPEFTMLEWYRLNFDAQQLMAEVDDFFQSLLKANPAIYMSYEELFLNYLNVNPLQASCQELMQTAQNHTIYIENLDNSNKDAWLNLLMSHCIEPELNQKNQPYIIYDFPISQAALARRSENDPRVAERFEVYMHGMELANGFHELTDVAEQKLRFEHYLAERRKLNMEPIPMPENFLAALQQGLPNCSGIALGIDRLTMIHCKVNSIKEVLSFTAQNA